MDARILIVDDEPGITNVLKITLQDAGYTVSTADDGVKAVELIDSQPFDIVLTDIRMPGMDGISLLKHIKKQHPSIEVIMISGHGEFKLAIESLKLDAVDFISKPIDNDVLEIALKRAHDKIKTQKALHAYTKDLEIRVEEKTRKLAESEKRYIQLFNESPSYLTIQDKNFTIIETNKIFKDHFNFKEGMRCHEVYKGITSPCPDCPVKKTFEDGESHTAEMDVILKDNSIRNIFIQTSAIKDADGITTHVMEMSTDVTMIHELQDHLAALGLHIGSISHGLKQVVTGLDGGAYLIESGLKKNNSQQVTEGWDIIKGKISEARQMVMNILFHSKKRKPDRTDIRLTDLVDELVSTIAPKAELENIAFTVDSPQTGTLLSIDKLAVFAAFRSILENAVDACSGTDRDGEISFSVQEKNNSIEFTIQDNGKGMPADKKEKIFNQFYSDKGNKGTGLGLFIASRSIKQHKGTITVFSEPGRFTRFVVTLPCPQCAQTSPGV